MKYGALFGWGIAIYAVLSLVWSALIVYGFTAGFFPRVAVLLTLMITAMIGGRSLNFKTWKDVLPYSAFWLLEAIALDSLLAVPYAGWGLFADFNIWVGYALLVIIPLFAPYTKSREIIVHT